MDTNQYVDNDDIREPWEGDDPRYCIEPLQPNPNQVIGDEEMVLVTYEEVA